MTSRTEEMVMGSDAHRITTAFQETDRQVPHLKQTKTETGTQFSYTPPQSLPSFFGAIDFDIDSAQTGAVTYVRQPSGGYKMDRMAEEKLGVEKKVWRKK